MSGSMGHIQGSKIAKGLPSVNLQYSKIEKAKTNEQSGALKGGPFGVFQRPFCRKTSNKLRGNFLFPGKKSHSAEKIWKGDPLGFSNIRSDAKQQKNEEETFWRKIFFRRKSLAVPKKTERGTLWSRPVWYVTRKNRKNLWFNSLSQKVQFGAKLLCKTFKNYLGQFVWIEKKSNYNSRDFMKRKLKRSILCRNLTEQT